MNIKQLFEAKAKLLARQKEIAVEMDSCKDLSRTVELREAFNLAEKDYQQIEKQIQETETQNRIQAQGAVPVQGAYHSDLGQEFRNWIVDDKSKTFAMPMFRAQTTTTTAGGFAIPDSVVAPEIEVVRSAFDILKPGVLNWLYTQDGAKYDLPCVDDTANSGQIVAESGDLTSGATDIVFTEKNLNAYNISSDMLKVQLELVQDAAVDILKYIRDILLQRVFRKLNALVISGTGSSQHNGLYAALTKGEDCAARSFDRTDLVNLVHSVAPEYRTNRSYFIMNDSTFADLKALAIGSADARPLWQPSFAAGEPATIEGFKYVINSNMEDVFPTYKPVIFADLSKYTMRIVKDFLFIKLNERFMDSLQYGICVVARSDGDWMTSAADAGHFLRCGAT